MIAFDLIALSSTLAFRDGLTKIPPDKGGFLLHILQKLPLCPSM
jgi:hypothetical protein